MVESRVKSIFSHIALEIFMVVGWADEEMQCKWLEGEECELVNLEKYIGRMLLCVTLNWQSRYFMFMWVVFFRCSHTSVRNRARRRFLVWWLRCDILLFGSFAGEGSSIPLKARLRNASNAPIWRRIFKDFLVWDDMLPFYCPDLFSGIRTLTRRMIQDKLWSAKYVVCRIYVPLYPGGVLRSQQTIWSILCRTTFAVSAI